MAKAALNDADEFVTKIEGDTVYLKIPGDDNG